MTRNGQFNIKTKLHTDEPQSRMKLYTESLSFFFFFLILCVK